MPSIADKIVRIFVEDFLEFGHSLVAARHVFGRRRAGNVKAGVRGGEIEPRVEQLGIGFFRLLEVFNRSVGLAVLEGGDAFVQEVASLEFAAARDARHDENHRSECRQPGVRFESIRKSSKHPIPAHGAT